MAWLIVQKTKPEVMELLDGLDDDAGRDLMESFIGTMASFKSVTEVMEATAARILLLVRPLSSETSWRHNDETPHPSQGQARSRDHQPFRCRHRCNHLGYRR
ncbi:hypothetical protein [Ensifer soli]|uniref:hypothetical protein n=1 Tax=Ciceribacter sp. sgz301302 TaxID=3342379 RepID=UPI0035B75142